MKRISAILRAACVIPHSESGGLRRFAPDEDEFTLGVAALERLLERSESGAPLETVHLVGRFPPSVDPWIAELLGHPVTVVRHDDAPGGVLAALAAASAEHLGSHAVIAVDAPAEGPAGPTGAIAVALSVGEGPGIQVSPTAGSESEAIAAPVPGVGLPSATRPAFALYAAFGQMRPGSARTVRIGAMDLRATAPIEWLGDWIGAPSPALPFDASRRAAVGGGHLFAVSEGAYVPWPRYVENLPSRWRFVAERCGHCTSLTFPVRGSCRSCHRSDALERTALPVCGGTVLASTVVAPGGQPTEFDDQVEASGPYGVVLVELAPMARVTLQVADALPGSVRIGDRVDTRIRRLYAMEGEWRYGRKAVPTAGVPR